MPKISVVVPIYGVERYIERCVRSLLSQTLEDIEYIFIDDCTPDKSVEILKAILDENHRIIKKNRWSICIERMPMNSGLPKVRQYGVKLAKGEYILHCDSDDWIDCRMLNIMYQKAKEDNADIVICDYFKSDGGNKLELVKGYILDDHHFVRNFILRKNKCCIWNKLIKRDLYQNNRIIFPKDNMGEDMALVLQLVLNVNVVSYVQEPLYYYFFNSDSISHKPSAESVLSRWKQQYNNVRLVEQGYKDIGMYEKYKIEFATLKYHAKQQIEPIVNLDNNYSLWKNTFPEINYTLLFNKYISIKEKVRYFLILTKIYQKFFRYVR